MDYDSSPASSARSPRRRHSISSQDRENSSSPATSPSSNGLFASPRRGPSDDLCLPKEAQRFFSDLGNYLPLGCLCFKDLTLSNEDCIPGQWRDITALPPVFAFEETLYSHLHKLAASGWIRVFLARSNADPRYLIFRIYILPFDVGLRYIERQSKRLYLALESLVVEIDISPDTWQGNYVPDKVLKFDTWATSDDGSLFWMFNKLPSPAPCIETVKEKYAHEALEDLLDPASVLPGLRTQLYPYQRRSAGLMLQRESVSTLDLDPRLERRTAPDGSTYYFGARDLVFLRHPRYYEACNGGVLAETMGLGKTVICLALVLATKHHPPKVPAHFALPPTRPSVGSLAQMAISTINRKSLPWRVEFQRIKHATGDDMASCGAKLEENAAAYEIPVEPMRWNRKTILPPPKKMTLASTTLIIVPQNLCKQWQSEIRKHVDAETLSILVMDDSKTALPAPDSLRSYDIVIFTRGRFEIEIKDGADDQGRRLGTTTLQCRCSYIGASRVRDCHCIRADELYDSPLKHLHFKRLIIDEGHFFSNTNNTAVSVANKLVTADHRWVVSGTPAKDLLGVEVDMSAAENLWHTPATKDSRDAVLEQRRRFSKKDDTNGAIKSLGSLASNFLKIKPWSASDTGERRVEWEEHIYRHEDPRKRTFSGFSTCLRRTLEGMVIKTQPEDVEKDIELPPLSHEVMRLEPSFYDKLTANLFTIVLTANAVTSERTDMDYLFHKSSQKARSQLISNLRQSAFFWTGFSEADVLAGLKSSNGYLAKEGTGCTESDRVLLTETLAFANTILESDGWKSLSRSHELGLFVDDWPTESAEHWAFDGSQKPLLTGMSQLLEAQKYVNNRAIENDPGDGLGGAGIRVTAPARYGIVTKAEDATIVAEKPILTKSGIPTSSIDGEPVLRRRASLSARGEKSSPKKLSKSFKVVKARRQQERHKASKLSQAAGMRNITAQIDTNEAMVLSDTKEQSSAVNEQSMSLSEDSPYLRSRIVGTTSAKLSYLISQILKYHVEEKILVFYDGDNVAYYIAQMLELLHIKHEIYAKSLAAHLKSEYVVRFDQEAQDRVLLMDVRNAAFGLNLPSASRIYFVNPVCRPNVEAQAIKRAHRIGQTRRVYVETLLLKGTIEEKMHDRSKRMTQSEHREASHLEDDLKIKEIIQSARIIPVSERETKGYGQMASLDDPQQLWGRPGWTQFSSIGMTYRGRNTKKRTSVEDYISPEDGVLGDGEISRKKAIRRTLDYVDCTGTHDNRCHTAYEADKSHNSDEEPILSRWRRKSLSTHIAPTAATPALLMARDPFMPSMAHLPDEHPVASSTRHVYTTGDDVGGSGTLSTGYHKLSISQLLNEEPAVPDFEPANPAILQEILRLL